jgi:hypothetical protein
MPKLIEGNYYQRRDGQIVGPVEKLIAGVTLGYNWFCEGWTYNEQGKFSFSPHEFDLVKESQEPQLETVVSSINGAGLVESESSWKPC